MTDDRTLATVTGQHAAPGKLLDYISLAKPRSVVPHLLTAAAAMFLAAGRSLPGAVLLFTLLGGGLVAAAANTFNSYLDRDIDAIMDRTRRRPLPDGRLSPTHALAFGAGIGLLGTVILGKLVDWRAAGLAAAALVYYVLPYTVWLKRRTYWSTIICSGIGAVPPLVGSIAVAGRIETSAVVLSAIVVLWTMPHFWALAVFRRGDYEQAGVRLIPDTAAARWAVFFSVLLVATTLLLTAVARMGTLYVWIVAALGVGFLSFGIRLLRRNNISNAARQFYVYSIVYITVLFAAVIIDRLILW